jgi:hypothetical protein
MKVWGLYCWVDHNKDVELLVAALKKAGCLSAVGFPDVHKGSKILWEICFPDDKAEDVYVELVEFADMLRTEKPERARELLSTL